MLAIRPCSKSIVQRITQVSSPSSTAITQLCATAKHPEANGVKRLYQYPKSPLHCQTHGPLGANCSRTSDLMDRIALGGQSARAVHTAAVVSSNLDLARLSNDFPDPSLWYVLTAIALTAVGRQHLLGQLWRHLAGAAPEVQGNGEPERIPQRSPNLGLSPEMEQEVARLEQMAVRLREGLMKVSVLLGYPRAINALSSLYNAQQQLSTSSAPTKASIYSAVFTRLTEAPLRRPYLLPNPPTGEPSVPVNNYPRGFAMLNKVYTAKHVPNILHNLSIASAGDITSFAVSRIYGDLLSDLAVLNERETGLALFVTCMAVALAAGPEEHGLAEQMNGHIYGARNLGASGAEVRAAADLALRVWESVAGGGFQDVPDPVKLVLEKAKDW